MPKSVGRGCDCQLGRENLLWIVPNGPYHSTDPLAPCSLLLAPCFWLTLANDIYPNSEGQLASTCFFSGSAVTPPNSNNWTAGRSRRSIACGHLARVYHFSHFKHRPQSVSSHKPLAALSTPTTAIKSPHPRCPLGIHSRYPSRPATINPHLAVLGKDAGVWS